MPGGNTRSVLHYAPFPLAFARGEGCSLWSVDGQRYTDFLGEYTAGLYGHSHPVIVEAVGQAIDRGLSFGGHNMWEAQLAALLCERFPALDLVRFTNSGTEANLMAVSTAAAITGRRGILVFDGAYHGSVFSFGAGGSPINAPFDFVLGTYNDVTATRALLEQPDTPPLAAILVEPMLGAGGAIPATTEFLKLLESEAKRLGALLIVDEVMTSRLEPGGLAGTHGIRPDLMTLGKYLAGGMSFGAFGGRRAVMDRFDPTSANAFPHAGTFNNNVLSMAAGVAGLSKVLTPAACVDLNRRGDRLRDALNDTFARRGVAMQVTGYGSVMTIHAVDGPIATPLALARSDQTAKELLFFDLLDQGFWIARRGMIVLSLPVGDAECEAFVTAVDGFAERHGRLLER